MTLIHTHDGVDLALDTVRLTDETTGYAVLAKVGQPEIINVTVDDPTGALSFTSHKVWKMREAACAAGNQTCWYGFVGQKFWTRGPYRTGAARVWKLQLVELNAFIGRRLLRREATTTNRPAETVSQRLTWLLTTVGFSGLVIDHGLVETSSAACDAHEYHGQYGSDVLRDLANQSGFNFFLRYREASNDVEIVFRDDLTNADDVSTLRISNDLDDVDELTTWFANPDAQGEQIPDRIGSRFQVSYDGGGDVIRENLTTASTFAPIDLVAPSRFIRNPTTATTYADHLLAQHDADEEYIRNLWIEKLPIANLNDVKVGQLIQAKFTHGPGWETFRLARVVRKLWARPQNLSEEFWRLGLEIQPVSLVDAEAIGIRLERPNDNYSAGTLAWNLGWDYDGDNFQAGDPPAPKYGPMDYYPVGTKPANGWEGIIANGDGPLSFSALASALGVANGASSCTLAITVNGATVGSGTQSNSTAGLHVQGYALTVTATDIAIANGDIVKAHMSFTGSWPGTPVIPSGTGNPTHHLLASGSLVP
jgi:hypothetical protein